MTEGEAAIPIEYIRECFEVVDGIVYWKERPRSHFLHNSAHQYGVNLAGKEAGSINNKGYRRIAVTYQGAKFTLLGHRVVWLFHTGAWPKQEIDHINRVRLDNRPSNLRDVPAEVNARNTSRSRGPGLSGAYRTRQGTFMSQFRCGDQMVYLGIFDTAEEAHAKYMQARLERKQAPTAPLSPKDKA